MTINHIRSVAYLLMHEGIKSALRYDLQEFKKRYSSTSYLDGRYINGMNGADYIKNSDRPNEFKALAYELLKELTHNGTLYFPKNEGLKDLIDSALVGRLQRKQNTTFVITQGE